MKKAIVIVVFFVLSLVFFVGCSGSQSVQFLENTAKYEIIKYDVLQVSSVQISFQYQVNRGSVAIVEYTIKGYDANGREIWKQEEKTSGRFEARQKSYTVSNHLSDRSYQTASVKIEDIKFQENPSYDWMGWTFGGFAAAGTVALAVVLIFDAIRKRRITIKGDPLGKQVDSEDRPREQ